MALIVTVYVPAGVPPVFFKLLLPPPQAAATKSSANSTDANNRKLSLRFRDLNPAEPIPSSANPGRGIQRAYIGHVCRIPSGELKAPEGPSVVTISVELLPGIAARGDREQFTPWATGAEHASATELVKPFCALIATVKLVEAPGDTVGVIEGVIASVKSGAADEALKIAVT